MGFRRAVIGVSTLAFLCTTLIAPVQADMVSTQQYLQVVDREARLDVIERAVYRDDVHSRLVSLGVDPADAMQRIARLPDQDLAAMAEQIEAMPAGGDSLLAVIGIVFVVLLILELTGVINIFNAF